MLITKKCVKEINLHSPPLEAKVTVIGYFYGVDLGYGVQAAAPPDRQGLDMHLWSGCRLPGGAGCGRLLERRRRTCSLIRPRDSFRSPPKPVRSAARRPSSSLN